MKWFRTGIWIVLIAGGLNTAVAGLQFRPEAQSQCVFAGDARNIEVVWHNPDDQMARGNIRLRIFQATSATAVLLGEAAGKQLEVLPHQTVLESVRLDFPAVKAETKFLIQWLADTNQILGTTEVLVYPTNLLTELKPLVKGTLIGVYDPQNELKPLLKNLPVGFEDLENAGLTNFSGKLAVIGPFASRAQMPDGFARQVKALAKKNVAVVWIQAAPGSSEKPTPSFYPVMENTNSIIIVQPALVLDLPENPQAQRNLIYFCQLALNPPAPGSLDLTLQP
jgi:hypothetical protein